MINEITKNYIIYYQPLNILTKIVEITRKF